MTTDVSAFLFALTCGGWVLLALFALLRRIERLEREAKKLGARIDRLEPEVDDPEPEPWEGAP
jgi:hypothetical protein